PLVLNTTTGVSPIQGPADLLGEIAAAALIVRALIALPRRAWLAGLLVGLAVQAKMIALIALPAFAVALWVWAPGRGWARIRETLRRSWPPLLLAAVPTLLFELAALIGMRGDYWPRHVRETAWFLRTGGQHVEPSSPLQKLQTLLDSWFVPWWLALLSGILVLGLAVVGLRVTRMRTTDSLDDLERRSVLGYAAASIAGGAVYVVWWCASLHTPLWVRHPSPGLFAFFPIVAIVACWGARRLWTQRSWRTPVLTAVVVVSVTAGLGVAGHVDRVTHPRQTLAAQRAAVEPIRAWVRETGTEWLAAWPWGEAVSAAVLSGAHVGLDDAPAMDAVPRLTSLPCETEVLVDAGAFRVCAAP
ncbi:MAG: hypothetical protein WA971_11680, partial [Microbacterium sp.]